MDYEFITNSIVKDPKSAGSLLNSVEKIGMYIDKMLPSIAAYFTTTLGYPFEMMEEDVKKMSSTEVLTFVLEQIRKKHFI